MFFLELHLPKNNFIWWTLGSVILSKNPCDEIPVVHICQGSRTAKAHFLVAGSHSYAHVQDREHRNLTRNARTTMHMRMSIDTCLHMSAYLVPDPAMPDTSLGSTLTVMIAARLCYWPWLGFLTMILPPDLVPHCHHVTDSFLDMTLILTLHLFARLLLNIAYDQTPYYHWKVSII